MNHLKEYAPLAAGGENAEAVMAAMIARSRQVDPAQFMLYGVIKWSQTKYFLGYYLGTNKTELSGGQYNHSLGGSDIFIYQAAINNLRLLEKMSPEFIAAQRNVRGNELIDDDNPALSHWLGKRFLTDETFHFLGAYNLIDPAFWYSLYQDYKYISDGETAKSWPLAMPRTSFALSLKGPEAILAVPIHDGETMVEPYVRTTLNRLKNFLGWGLDLEKQVALSGPVFKSIDLSAQGHSWEELNGLGYAVGAGAVINTTANFGLGAEFLYKSKGDLQGEQYGQGLTGAINAKVYF